MLIIYPYFLFVKTIFENQDKILEVIMTTSIIFEKIKELCSEREITVTQLTRDLGLGKGTIEKWKLRVPSVEKVSAVANYFGVSIDYLMGITNIKKPADCLLKDDMIISFQRAKERMSPEDRERAMNILKAGFDYAFKDDDEN